MYWKDANSVNAVNGSNPVQIPSQAVSESLQACVETLHVLPHPALQKGKDKVRTAGKRTGRGSRNDYPLYDVRHHTVNKQHECKDLRDDLVSGVGTYPVGDGPTATVFKSAWKLPIADVEVYEDGNITIDSSDDAKGGVFAKEAIVLVQGKAPWQYNERKPNIGGGANAVYHYDEYAGGERLAGGSTSAWGLEIYSDATAPA